MSSDSPAAILFDEFGNPVGVVKDGYFYRLQVESVITDGYNGLVSVKPPNTPAVPADTALVVAISPNNDLQVAVSNFPATQSVIQGTVPWVVSDNTADGYLANILANQTNGTQITQIDGYVYIGNDMSIGTVNQGNPNTLPGAWPVAITDGSNVLGTSAHPLTVDFSSLAPVIVNQGTSPWIVQDAAADGYLASMLANQTNGAQRVIIDGYVETSPNVFITNFPADQVISGTVAVSNFPVAQTVLQGTSPWTVSDSVGDGYLASILANQTNGAQQVVVDGYVEVIVSNFPADQVISGTVAVSNFPTIQSVSQSTSPWIVSDSTADGYLASILANQTNGLQKVIVDGYADVIVANFPSVQNVSGVGTFSVQEVPAPTAISTNVSASVSSVVLLSSNSNRLGATVWNDSTTATLYLKLGTTASTSSYTVQVFPSGYYEVPFGYIGEIDGIWSAAVGAARISELT
jgi:hypothetical protein